MVCDTTTSHKRRRRCTLGDTSYAGSAGIRPEMFSSSMMLLTESGQVDLDQMAAARVEMEAACCRLAIENRTDEQLAGLEAEIAIEQDVEISDQDFCASEVRFHRLVVDATGNPLMRFLMNALIEMLLPISNMIIYRVRDRRTIAGFHQNIVLALRERDADAAITAIRGLIAYTRDLYAAADAARKAREMANRG